MLVVYAVTNAQGLDKLRSSVRNIYIYATIPSTIRNTVFTTTQPSLSLKSLVPPKFPSPT